MMPNRILSGTPVALLVMIALAATVVPTAVGTGAAGEMSPASFQDTFQLPRDPERLLTEILAREEFQESAWRSFLYRVTNYIDGLIAKIRAWLRRFALPAGKEFDYEFFMTVLGTLLVVLLVIGLLMLLAHVGLKLIKRRHAAAKRPAVAPIVLEGIPDQLREEAVSLAQRGKFREALILLFRSVLRQLDEIGLIKLHPSRTNREILNTVPRKEPIRVSLAEMIGVFNAVRYGTAQCSRPDFDRFLVLADSVMGRPAL